MQIITRVWLTTKKNMIKRLLETTGHVVETEQISDFYFILRVLTLDEISI